MLKFEDHGDMNKYISNHGIAVGKFVYSQVTNNWTFVLEEPNYLDNWKARTHPSLNFRQACAPHVAAFIDEHLALLNIAARLTS